MRVLHAPVNIGNQPWVLSRFERELGVDSRVVLSYPNRFGYQSDTVLGRYGSLKGVLARVGYGVSAPFRYDVLHYYFGSSLMTLDDLGPHIDRFPFLDVRMARRLGRKVFFTLQGCDVRLARESNQRNQVTMCKPDGCSSYATCISRLDDKRRSLINDILPLADRVFYLNPELGHSVPGGTFLPYTNVDLDKVKPVWAAAGPRFKVLHAPTDDSIKGSALIEAALIELAQEFEFDYVAIRGLPHAEAMSLYRDADLVIDQVLSGWYGGFAVELMAMGKPVACYVRDEDLQVLPPGMREDLPIVRVDPRKLVIDLRAAFRRRREWARIGAASRAFVAKWHNPRAIARAMVDSYNDAESRFRYAGDPIPVA